jgi:raffinose/stachyose/melibiose transport system substrate-binding protein
MTTTKRILFFIIAGLISVQLVSASGSDEAAEGGGVSVGMTFDEPVTITWQTWSPTQEIVNEMLAAWSAKFPNIEVEIQILSYGEHIEVLKTAFSAGASAGPDVASYQPGAMIDAYTRFLEPLAPWAEAEWGADWQDMFYDIAVEQVEWTGEEFYMLPGGWNTTGLWANLTLLEEYGLGVPENLDDLENMRDTLSSDGFFTLLVGFKNDWPAQDLFFFILDEFAQGVFYEAQDGLASFDDPGVVEAFEMWKYLHDSEIINPGSYGIAHYMEAVEPFQKGQAALLLNGSWHTSSAYLNNLNIAENQVGGFVPVMFPDLNGDGVPPRFQASMNRGYGVNNSLDDYKKAAAWEFAKFCVVDEGNQFQVDKFQHFSSVRAMSPAEDKYLLALERFPGAGDWFVDDFIAADQWYLERGPEAQGAREPKYAELKHALYELLAEVALEVRTPEEAAAYLQEVSEGIDR